ncbi:MAG: hypothetical protein HQL75_15580 [Magnetococcales bacterium]|nr:hypothetical protein [Magnetococcales bacterium]
MFMFPNLKDEEKSAFREHWSVVEENAPILLEKAYLGKRVPAGYPRIPSDFVFGEDFSLDKTWWVEGVMELAFINWQVERRVGNFRSCGSYVQFGGCLAEAIHRIKPIIFKSEKRFPNQDAILFNDLFAVEYGWCFAFIFTRLLEFKRLSGESRSWKSDDFRSALTRIRNAGLRSDEMYNKLRRFGAMHHEEMTLFYDSLLKG